MVIEEIERSGNFYLLEELGEDEYAEMCVKVESGSGRLQLSSSYGCSGYCPFCDYGLIFYSEFDESQLMTQFETGLKIFKDKLNSECNSIEFNRMGEPTENQNVLKMLETIASKNLVKKDSNLIISTVFPSVSKSFFQNLIDLERYFRIQIKGTFFSTDSVTREKFINTSMGSPLEMTEIYRILSHEWKHRPVLKILVAGYDFDFRYFKRIFGPNLGEVSVDLVEQNIAMPSKDIDYRKTNRIMNEVLDGIREGGYVRNFRKDDVTINTGILFSSIAISNALENI